MLDRQDILNRAVQGLASQGFIRSLAPNETGNLSCAYRGNLGRKCAVGHLMSDDLYHERFEGVPITGFSSGHLTEIFGRFSGGEDLEFVSRLQWAHDSGLSPHQMKMNLKALIEQFGLQTPSELR